jgi:PTS system cellobiose-specific IIC component
MDGLLGVIRRHLAAAGERTGRSIVLLSVRDGIVAVLPLVLIGSFFYLLVEPPLVRVAWQKAYAAAMSGWIPRFVLVFKATTGMISVYAAFAIAYHLARRRDLDGLAAGLIAVTADLAVVGPLRVAATPDRPAAWMLQLEKVGPAGLFVAILVALWVVEVQRFVVRRNWVVRLPPSVPEAVYRSFLSLVPAFLGIASLWFVVHGLRFDLFALAATLSRPLQSVGNSLPGILTVVLIDSVIWLFGIHAITILAVMKPIWLAMLTQNMEAALAGQAIPNLAPREFYIWFVWMGGSGTSLALVAHLLAARSQQLRGIAKVGIVPALFNINDPIMFGAPVVMNPTLAVPFIAAPVVCAINAWAAFHFGMVTRPHLDILWTLPAPVGAFGTTSDPKALVLLVLNLGLAYLIYAPFVRAYDRRLLAQEAAGGPAAPAAAAGTAGTTARPAQDQARKASGPVAVTTTGPASAAASSAASPSAAAPHTR